MSCTTQSPLFYYAPVDSESNLRAASSVSADFPSLEWGGAPGIAPLAGAEGSSEAIRRCRSSQSSRAVAKKRVSRLSNCSEVNGLGK